MRTLKRLLLILMTLVTTSAPAATWYIRQDGGTRYTAARVSEGSTGQCDGLADAPYPGSGTNQHCAFGDVRWLWDDQTYGYTTRSNNWAINGGDTVIIDNTKTWRVGFDGNTTNDPWCAGANGAAGCTMSPIPSGSAANHTRFLGRNYASCNAAANKPDAGKTTKLYGGHSVYNVINLQGSQYVDVQCLDISSFNPSCQLQGAPQNNPCQRGYPVDDFVDDGIATNNITGQLLLQDIYVHGTNSRGIHGQEGNGTVTANRVWISITPQTGWDFDDGTASGTGSFILENSIIEWSGCQQKTTQPYYAPTTDQQTAADITYCFSQGSGNVIGDGIGTPPNTGFNVSLDRDVFRFNTQDGEDFGHADTGSYSISITNSLSYSNLGGTYKWGWAYSNIIFENNLGVADCLRMLSPLPGADSTVNQYLTDGCRAGDAYSFNFQPTTTALFAHNALVSYAPIQFDFKCVASGTSDCSGVVWTLSDNIVLGYGNPSQAYNGHTLPATFCGAGCNDSTKLIGTINRDHNIFFGVRDCSAINTQTIGSANGTSNSELCANPSFVGQPATFSTYSILDNFKFSLSSGSPAIHAGAPITNLVTDYAGNAYATPPSIGALEFGSTGMPAGYIVIKGIINVQSGTWKNF